MTDVAGAGPSKTAESCDERVGDSWLASLSHWRTVALVNGLGTLRIDLARGQVLLDAVAVTQHSMAPPESREMTLDFWLGLLSEADRLRMHAVVKAVVQSRHTEGLTVRLPWPVGRAPTTLEFAFRLDCDSEQIVGTCRDVTEAQNIEEVRRQRIAAERASLAKSEFMSQVSHELRTPLNAILGFAQLMAMDNDEPLVGKQQERLQILHQSGLRLLSLVDQLLQIGKIEQGKVSLRPRAVNVYSLARRCVDALAPMAAERDVAIQIDVAGADTAAVRADSNALEQVLVNLLSNAIKYNRHGGRVTLRYRAEDGGEITVDDTGPGLAASQMARLFEPFNRLDAARGNVQGTGLGLVISRQLVEAMGGTMQVWSEVGVGSRFRVALPRARSTRAKDAETLPLDMPSQWLGAEQFRVLYIEDDEVNLVLMDQLFAAQPDWSLAVAMTGAAGLAEAVRQRPDVILLDLNLPDMNGQEVLQRLSLDRRTRDIPVVAVSADAMPANVRRGRALGFVDYWTKPLDLLATVSKLKALAPTPK